MAPHEQELIPTEAVVPNTTSFKIVTKALELPIVNDALTAATKLHTEAIAYPYVNQVETIIGGLLTKAEDTITPCVSEKITSTVTSTASQLDTLACTGLDQFTTKVPALKLPTDELTTATTNATFTLANTVVNFLATFMVVRFILTCGDFFLGFVITSLEAILGLDATALPGFFGTVLALVKTVLGHLKASKVMLEEVIKNNTIDQEKEPKEDADEKPKEE